MVWKDFKNFIEPLEADAVSINLFRNRERLLQLGLNKYKNICFQVDDPVYSRRVVYVEWNKKY